MGLNFSLRLFVVILCLSWIALTGSNPVGASPPVESDEAVAGEGGAIERGGIILQTVPQKRPAHELRKEIDQPNPKDFRRLRHRQRLMESMTEREGKDTPVGLLSEIEALAKTGKDRLLVILVEFGGTDTFTWTPGVSTWDPLGKANPEEYTGTVGDCSKIITSERTFTYSGPLHNTISRPLSPEDASGNTIWTPDFARQYYEDIIAGNGVVIDYTHQDGSLIHEDFTGKSVRTYYGDMSGGRYTFTADIHGWLKVNHSVWWYGADVCPGNQSGASVAHHGAILGAGSARSLVQDALEALKARHPEPEFWAQYDQDKDGYIDRVWIIHAGLGEEDNAEILNRTSYGEAALWSHSSSLGGYEIVPGIKVGPYIMMPENCGIGVLAHEFGHNLGADDLYAYSEGNTSPGFWTNMADDWVDFPIGMGAPALDPYHLDRLGWLRPKLITDPRKTYTVTLGQASNFPGGEDVFRGVKIALPKGHAPLPVQPIGKYQWWGGKNNLTNAMMTSVKPIRIPLEGADLAFSAAYDTEESWDFLWIQASENGGKAWKTLTNANTSCLHASEWIGGSYGFPDDLCGAGIGGLTGKSKSFPRYERQTFQLSALAGKDILLRFWYMTDHGTIGLEIRGGLRQEQGR